MVAPDIEIIRNPTEAVDRIQSLVASAKSDIVGIFPTLNAFRRQLRIANIWHHHTFQYLNFFGKKSSY